MPRHEKRIAIQLGRRNVEHFLPLYEEVHAWADRHRRLSLPLFPGYLFVNVTLLEKWKVMDLSGVIGFVGHGSSPVFLDESEITRLRRGLAEVHGAPHPFLEVGERVRIRRGAFSGAEGVLVRESGASKVVICLDAIRQAIAVAIDVSCLEAIMPRSTQ